MEGKGNDGKGNTPERDLWEIQQELWDKLDNQYNFTFDCCASETNSKTDLHSSDFKSVKREDIVNMCCWMNPPFSKSFEIFEHFFRVVEGGVAIFRCDNMETKVWQEIILRNADWIFIPKGRVSYTPFETGDMRNGMGTRFPSALIGINVPPPQYIEGKILFTKLNEVSADSAYDFMTYRYIKVRLINIDPDKKEELLKYLEDNYFLYDEIIEEVVNNETRYF